MNKKPIWLEESEARLQGQRILITGATGFIGSRLARRLKAIGVDAFALERTPGSGSFLAREGIAIVRGDIAEMQQMDHVLQLGFDSIAHLATWARGRRRNAPLEINVEGTRYLAEKAAATGVRRFLFTSSIAVYGTHGDQDVDESFTVKPFGDPYGDSKIAAELAIREVGQRTGLKWVIVRPGMVYGPGSKAWTERIAVWAKQGRIPIVDGGHGTAYPILVENLLDLLVVCLAHPSALERVFNGVDDGLVTLGDFLGAYMDMIPTSRALYVPGGFLRFLTGLVDPFSQELKVSYVVDQMRGRGRIRNDAAHSLGWEPRVTLGEGLRLSEEWLREEGLI